MSGVIVRGLSALQKRFDAGRVVEPMRGVLRQEADAIAKDAARAAPGNLGRTVEVKDSSQGDEIAYTVGSAHRAARFIEYGTLRRPVTPWLFPVFRARLPRVKQNLRKMVLASFKRPHREV